MQPNRDTKAELNRRGEVCEAFADTGISRRLKWTERRYEDWLGDRTETFLPSLEFVRREQTPRSLFGFGVPPVRRWWQAENHTGTPEGIPVAEFGLAETETDFRSK
ncbi:MAG: hypothetical protein U1F83_14340 [Verrucomicrobiota bacterium]